MAMHAPMMAYKRRKPPMKGMLNDIWETPKTLRALIKETLRPQDGKGTGVSFPQLEKPLPSTHGLAGRTPLEVMAACGGGTERMLQRFILLGVGTSYHAAVLGEYLIEHMARIPVDVQYASEFRYSTPIVSDGDVVIVVSNSGETDDVVQALANIRAAPSKGVLTIGVVNELNSTIARDVDVVIGVHAGAEAGVACTKVFSNTAATFVLLATAIGEACKLPIEESLVVLEKLRELPDLIQKVIEKESRILQETADEKAEFDIGQCPLWDIGCQNVLAGNFIYLGRGFNFPIALEGAMKCKEIAYIHAEGYPAAEMKHGPIALIDQFMPVVVIAPRADPSYEKIKANLNEVRARSGSTIAITEEDNMELDDLCEYVIRVPETHEYLMPLIAVIPLQLLSYMMGVLRGNEVDNPRNLQKTCLGRLRGSPSPQKVPSQVMELSGNSLPQKRPYPG